MPISYIFKQSLKVIDKFNNLIQLSAWQGCGKSTPLLNFIFFIINMFLIHFD